jgi:hypothetical protein
VLRKSAKYYMYDRNLSQEAKKPNSLRLKRRDAQLRLKRRLCDKLSWCLFVFLLGRKAHWAPVLQGPHNYGMQKNVKNWRPTIYVHKYHDSPVQFATENVIQRVNFLSIAFLHAFAGVYQIQLVLGTKEGGLDNEIIWSIMTQYYFESFF